MFQKNKYVGLYTIDWKSLFGVLIILLGLAGIVFIFSNLPVWLNKNKSMSFNGETIGKIFSIEDIEFNSQDFNGGEIKTYGFKISYSYIVDGKNFTQSIKLTCHPSTYKLVRNYNNGSEIITIKYDTKNPQNSTILLED